MLCWFLPYDSADQPSFPPASHPSRPSQHAKLSSLCCIAASHQLSISHVVGYICRCCFLCCLFSFPHCVHKSVLCICICIPSLHIGSLILIFQIPQICINIRCLFSSFFKFIFIFYFNFYFIFKLYKIVLVLPNIKMNPPQVYMCSPS